MVRMWLEAYKGTYSSTWLVLCLRSQGVGHGFLGDSSVQSEECSSMVEALRMADSSGRRRMDRGM